MISSHSINKAIKHMKNLLLAALITFISVSNISAQKIYNRNILMQLYQDQEYAKAIEYLLPYATDFSDSIQYNDDLGYAYYMNNQEEEAISFFKKVYSVKPSDIIASLYIAQIFAGRIEQDSSLFYYKNLISYSPSNYRYWQRAGEIFSREKELDSAEYYFQNGYSVNPHSGSLTVGYVSVLLNQKKAGKADSILEQFLSIDSVNRDVISKRIDVSYHNGDYKKAIYWGEKLWKDSVNVLLPYISLDYCYLYSDSLDKCIALYEWLDSRNNNIQTLMYCASQAYAKKKNYSKSNELLDECLKQSLQDDAVTYFEAKADNYEEMKLYQQAINCYDTSFYIFQKPPDLYYCGRIYDKYFNNKIKARYYYNLFIEKVKAPRNSGEKKAFDYIKEYLNPKK